MQTVTDRRTPLTAAGVFLVTFAVYAAMVPSAVGLGDEAEAQMVPYILGIAHPTGFPLYVLAGWVWSHILAVGVVAWRLNLFNAFCSAVTAGGVFLLAYICARDRIAATLAALAFAFGGMTWTSALHANAQVVSSMLTVFVLVTATLFARTGKPWLFAVACLCNGLALATHPNAMFTLPAIAVALVWQRRALSRRMLFAGAAALLLPLALYGYLPIRSAVVAAQGLDPNAAPPLFGAGRLGWDINSPRTLDGFMDEALGRSIHAGAILAGTSRASHLPYILPLWFSLLVAQFQVWLLVLAAAGAAALARTDRRALVVIVAGTIGGVAFLYAYRLDAHLDRYVIISFAAVSALAASAGRLFIAHTASRIARTITIVALAAVTAASLIEHQPVPIPLDRTGLGIIADVETNVPDGAIVIAQWEQATPLAYASYVSHTLGKRTVVAGWPSEYNAHTRRWAQQRPVYYFVDGLAWTRLEPFPPYLKVVRNQLRGYAIMQVLPK